MFYDVFHHLQKVQHLYPDRDVLSLSLNELKRLAAEELPHNDRPEYPSAAFPSMDAAAAPHGSASFLRLAE